MLLLAFLGLSDFSHSLPLNDRFLHITCFCVATGVFYFIFDVEEYAFRILSIDPPLNMPYLQGC